MSAMNLGGVSTAAFAQTYGVAVAKKAQENTQVQGQNAMQLIQSAAQPAAPKLMSGQTINVMA